MSTEQEEQRLVSYGETSVRLSQFLALTLGMLCIPTVLHAEERSEYQSFEQEVRPALIRLCGECHAPDDDGDDVAFLKTQHESDLSSMRSLWGSVAEQLRNRTMPPPEESQPSEQERIQIAAWIESSLQKSACEQGPYAGAVTTRRLNRLEYHNTIRDLLGVESDAISRFPVDGSGGEGFNNNGETLFLPSLLMSRYLESAELVLDEAIPSPPLRVNFAAHGFKPEVEKTDAESPGRQLKSGDTISKVVRVYAGGKHQFLLSVVPGAVESRLIVKLNGIRAEVFKVAASEQKEGRFPIRFETQIDLPAGVHEISLKCTGEAGLEFDSLELKLERKGLDEQARKKFEELTGIQPGKQPVDSQQLATLKLRQFSERAFRRPVNDQELASILKLYDRGVGRGDPYEESLKLAMKGVLVSSPFLFRIEEATDSTEPVPLGAYELATRLSYFLWGSMPDDELRSAAADGSILEEATLKAQIARMLADQRARYFVEEFVGQWLGTREVGSLVAPDTSKFKGEFTTELLLGFREEPIQLFQYVLQNERPIMELISADYVLVNRRLGKHYGINDKDEKVKDEDWPWTPDPQLSKDGPFEKKSVEADKRGGFLGMGGVHLLTSYPTRTSPVLRGGWILETLLGVHIPNPPPDVPELSKSKKKGLSIREQLAIHRDHAACSACHNLIDPPGFALENYDAIGRWRDEEAGKLIDASARFGSGEEVNGLAGLKQFMQDKRPEFYRHFVRKLLGFAIGRSLEDRDDCTIQQISESLLNGNDSINSAVTQVILSVPFRFHQHVEPGSR